MEHDGLETIHPVGSWSGAVVGRVSIYRQTSQADHKASSSGHGASGLSSLPMALSLNRRMFDKKLEA